MLCTLCQLLLKNHHLLLNVTIQCAPNLVKTKCFAMQKCWMKSFPVLGLNDIRFCSPKFEFEKCSYRNNSQIFVFPIRDYSSCVDIIRSRFTLNLHSLKIMIVESFPWNFTYWGAVVFAKWVKQIIFVSVLACKNVLTSYAMVLV